MQFSICSAVTFNQCHLLYKFHTQWNFGWNKGGIYGVITLEFLVKLQKNHNIWILCVNNIGILGANNSGTGWCIVHGEWCIFLRRSFDWCNFCAKIKIVLICITFHEHIYIVLQSVLSIELQKHSNVLAIFGKFRKMKTKAFQSIGMYTKQSMFTNELYCFNWIGQ